MDHSQDQQPPHAAGQTAQPQPTPGAIVGHVGGTQQPTGPPPTTSSPQSSTPPGHPPPILIPSAFSEPRPANSQSQPHLPLSGPGQPIVSPRPTRLTTQIEKLEAEKLDDGSPSRRGSSPGHGGDQHPQYHPPQMPRVPQRTMTDSGLTRVGSRRSAIDWIVPIDERKDLPPRPKTLGERLAPTRAHAKLECEKYMLRAKMTGFALNAAIGMQVLLGALVTAVSAATVGRQTSIATSVLGGMATLVASYLARARGSNEPELSITRVKDLEHFQRECDAFIMDHGHKTEEEGPLADRLSGLRSRFEDLLGNASGERKLAPPV
ncbi:hypothetical protein ONZ45_g3826 [Pleurotus djamor]|nr:hypothetical protein ONZ45_g3826 [Pleurotus djamor]